MDNSHRTTIPEVQAQINRGTKPPRQRRKWNWWRIWTLVIMAIGMSTSYYIGTVNGARNATTQSVIPSTIPPPRDYPTPYEPEYCLPDGGKVHGVASIQPDEPTTTTEWVPTTPPATYVPTPTLPPSPVYPVYTIPSTTGYIPPPTYSTVPPPWECGGRKSPFPVPSNTMPVPPATVWIPNTTNPPYPMPDSPMP